MVQKLKYRVQMLKKLQIYAMDVRKLFWLNLAAAVAGVVLSLILPLFYSLFIEKVILGQKLKLVLPVIAGYIVIQLLNTGIAFLRNFCQYRINNEATVKMKLKILDNALKRPFKEYDKIDPGQQKMVMDDALVKLCDFTNTQSSEYLINCVSMTVMAVLLFYLEWHLALVLLLAVPVTFWLNHMNGKAAKKNNEKEWENDQAMGSLIYSAISGWREVRALNLEGECQKEFTYYGKRDMELFVIFTEHWVTRHFTIPKIKDEFLMQFLLYFLGGILIFRGNITIGILLMFAKYYSMTVESIQNVVGFDTDLQINTTYYDKVMAALDEEIDRQPAIVEDVANCNVEFQNVSFYYEKSDGDVLHDFSMKISQGERVGIVGESGKGKSTILKLIAGLLEPTKGRVLFGGYPLEDLPLHQVHRRVGFVFQENMLFNTTIRENLLYGNENATEEEMKEACRRAYIDEFIQSLPEKYDTVIGEKGIKLSGGQKQRMVLARLFLKDVDLYIFDEATSALDQRTEAMLQQAIEAIGRDKTILIVSHRESSLNLCDRLIYL